MQLSLFPSILLMIALLGFSAVSARLFRASLQPRRSGFERAAEHFSTPIWREENGVLLWANQAFLDKINSLGLSTASLADFRVKDEETPALISLNLKKERIAFPHNLPYRAILVGADENMDTPDCHFNLRPLYVKDKVYLMAESAEEQKHAEDDRVKLVQHVSQTFTYAPVGIAFFDTGGTLTMFNPRLSELMGLSPSWLATGPTLMAFLNRLHDKGNMPEPPDFKAWCKPFERACMPNKNEPSYEPSPEVNAEESTEHLIHDEDWHMPDGQIYHVRANAHPNTALTLYVEDVTNHVNTSRAYHTDLKNLYLALDALENAVVIFNRGGSVMFRNRKFEHLWGEVFSSEIPTNTIKGLVKTWSDHCHKTTVFETLHDFIMQLDVREVWTTEVVTKTGQTLGLRAVPLRNGQTCCEFYLQEQLIRVRPNI